MLVILMGASGCGKTTIGGRLAAELGFRFLDADDFHSPENIRKMSAGQGLTDEDRAPWLTRLRQLTDELLESGQDAILACSALKEAYRRTLVSPSAAPGSVRWVYLKGTAELLRRRLRNRSGHFVGETLVRSQLADLEEPDYALAIDIDERPGRIIEHIRAELGLGAG
jgi:gluconokinase